ncbi:MAG: hypothetical protein M3N82_18380, partial [Pseudomonadota bacterium]|nr:hypothetical protein [Pseudomonadota bacterium]
MLGVVQVAAQFAPLGLEFAQARIDDRRLDEIEAADARQLLPGAQPVDRAEQVALRRMGLCLGADRAQFLAQRLGALG